LSSLEANPTVNLDSTLSEKAARTEVLRNAIFPDLSEGGKASLDDQDAEDMQKRDPLATQIWKLYSKTKSTLPNQERMENLTWRMMAMTLKRERAQSRYVLRPLPLRSGIATKFFPPSSTTLIVYHVHQLPQRNFFQQFSHECFNKVIFKSSCDQKLTKDVLH